MVWSDWIPSNTTEILSKLSSVTEFISTTTNTISSNIQPILSEATGFASSKIVSTLTTILGLIKTFILVSIFEFIRSFYSQTPSTEFSNQISHYVSSNLLGLPEFMHATTILATLCAAMVGMNNNNDNQPQLMATYGGDIYNGTAYITTIIVPPQRHPHMFGEYFYGLCHDFVHSNSTIPSDIYEQSANGALIRIPSHLVGTVDGFQQLFKTKTLYNMADFVHNVTTNGLNNIVDTVLNINTTNISNTASNTFNIITNTTNISNTASTLFNTITNTTSSFFSSTPSNQTDESTQTKSNIKTIIDIANTTCSYIPLTKVGSYIASGTSFTAAVVSAGVNAMGFTAGGVTAGSIGAGMMSASGNVAAGSTVAILQSAGTTVLGPIGIAGAATVGLCTLVNGMNQP